MKHLFFDLDGTLIKCNKYYYKSDIDTLNLLCKLFDNEVNPLDILNYKNEVDTSEILKNKFTSVDRFANSWVRTYSKFTKKYSLFEFEQVRKSAMSFIPKEYELYDNAFNTIEYLSKEPDLYTLHIWTMGNVNLQFDKLKQTNLLQFFNGRVYIPEIKSPIILNKILNDLNIKKEEVYIIGNSKIWDINPAIILGVKSVYIPNEEFMDSDILDEVSYIKINSLDELLEVI